MEILIVLAVIVVILIAIAVGNYNNAVRLDRMCADAWAGIDIALKRRYDLIPNLVETTKAYAKHEQETFERVITLRNQAVQASGDVAATIRADQLLAPALMGLIRRVEAYPELRSNANFLSLQAELVNTEDRIAAARRFYNANVRDFNIQIETFPGVLFAGGRAAKQPWEVDEAVERTAVKVSL